MAGVQRVRLNNLNTNIKNAHILGIIIAKNSPRIISSKKKNGELRGVTSFTLRDSSVDTINVEVWGSEYFVLTLYERFLVGDVVEISSPRICLKRPDDETFRPHVTSPFYLSLNEGNSDICIHGGEEFSSFLPLLHIPTKPASGYCGLAEILKLPEESNNIHVDLLVVVKSVKPPKKITTRLGTEMTVRSVELMDNTTPATLMLDLFDMDTIQRAEEWRPLESVLFVSDARVRRTSRALSVQKGARAVVTHQPHTADAEALRLYARTQDSAAAWHSWSGERGPAATAAQLRDRLAAPAPFTATLHALLTHLQLDDVKAEAENDDLRVSFADHTGELSARIPYNVLGEALGITVEQLKTMTSDERSAVRWKILLEQCSIKLAASPPRLTVIGIKRASPADPIPLY